MDYNYHGPVVGFDLDDTLFRERDFCRSGFRFLCNPEKYRALNTTRYPDREVLQILEEEMDARLSRGENPFDPFEKFFKEIAETRGEEWDLQKHIEAYRSHIPDGLHPAEGVEATLQLLEQRGIRMAIITDGRGITQRRKIETLGLDRFVAPEMILISGETGYDKHHKEMFSRVVRFYPEASGFYYVGNNPTKDFYHPNLLGWTTLQVPPHPDDVHLDVQPLSDLHKARINLNSFEELTNYIK